jgi:hypothetical protein
MSEGEKEDKIDVSKLTSVERKLARRKGKSLKETSWMAKDSSCMQKRGARILTPMDGQQWQVGAAQDWTAP